MVFSCMRCSYIPIPYTFFLTFSCIHQVKKNFEVLFLFNEMVYFFLFLFSNLY